MALDDLATAMLGAVGPKKPINPVTGGGKGASNVENLPADLKKIFEVLTKYVEQLNKEYKQSGKIVKKTSDELDGMNKLLGKVGKQFDKLLLGSTGVTKAIQKEKKERASIAKIEADLHKRAQAMGGGRRGGGGNNVVPTLPPNSGGNDGLRYAEEFEATAGRGLSNFFAGLGTATLGYEWYQTLTDGMFRQNRRYIMEMKEIAYQAQGITNETYDMQMAFLKTEKVVQRTGYSLTVYQNALVEASKRGTKNVQETLKTGLNLARVMGLTKEEAIQVSDTFLQWKGTLGLTDNELADVSRGIQDVSRLSGVTGKNLMEAVKASEKFMDNMRATGNLTANAAKNIIGLQAELQKRGVADAFANVQQGLSNSAKLLFESSAETQALLFNSAALVGRTEDAFAGMLTQTKGGMKDLAAGMKQYFANLTGGLDFSQIENLNPMMKTQLNLVVTKATGMGLDDYRRSVESLEASSKTYVDRLMEINKELLKHVDSETRLTLERKKQDLTLTKSFEFSTALSDAVKETNRMTDAVSLMQKKLGPGWEDVRTELLQITKELAPELASSVASGSNAAIAKAIGLSTAKSLKKVGGVDYSKQVLDAIKSNNMSKFQDLQAKMNAEQQSLGVKTIAELDPLTEVHQQLIKMNEQLRDSVTPILEKMLYFIGSQGIYASGVGLMGASSYFAAGTGDSILDLLELAASARTAKTASSTANVASQAVNYTSLATAFTPQVTGTIPGAATGATVAGTLGTTAAATGAGATIGTGGTILIVAAALEAFLAVIGGVRGAMAAATEAANMFEVAQEDLTMGQYYAAKSAGALTGALNWMTFGIFDKWLNVTGDLTKSIAKINELFPVLSVGMMVTEGLLGTLWGIVKAVGEVVKGIGEYAYLVMEPFMELGKEVFNIFKSFMEPLGLFSSKLSETGTVFNTVSEAIRGIGTMLRWVLRGLGMVINVALKLFIKPLIGGLRAVAGLANGLGKILGRVFEGVGSYLLGIWQVVQGILTFDIKKVFKGIINQIGGLVKTAIGATVGLILGIPQMILQGLAAIPTYIGTMFDNMEGTLGSVLKMLVMPFKILGNFLRAMADTLGGVYEAVVGLLTLDFSRFGKGLWNTISAIPAMLWNALMDIGSNLYKIFVEFPGWLARKVMDGFSYVFMELPIMLLNSLWSGLENLTANEWIGPIFEPLKEVFYELHDALKPMYKAFVEFYNVLFEDNGMGSILEMLKPIVRSLAKGLGFLLKVALLPVIGAIKQFAAVTEKIAKMFEYLTSLVKDFRVKPVETLTNTLTNSKLSTLVSNSIGTGLKDAVQIMLDYLKGKLNGVKDSIKSLIPGYEFLFGKKKIAQDKPQKFDWNTVAAGNTEEMKQFQKTASGLSGIPKNQKDIMLKNKILKQDKTMIPLMDFGRANKALPTIVETKDGPMIQSVFDAPNQRPAPVPAMAAGLPDTNQEQLFGDQAAAKNTTNKTSLQEMSGMLAVNEEQLHYMQLLHSDMSKLVDLMTPKKSGMTEEQKNAQTRSQIKPRSSPNYYAWQFGRNSQNASKGVINDGR